MDSGWLNYRHLYYFWVIAKEGSFSKAAKKLRLSQSSLSHQVKTLEDLAGTQLFERRSKRVFVLSRAGKKALEHADLIFPSGQELERWLRGGGGTGPVTLRAGVVGSLSKNFQFQFLERLIRSENVKLEIQVGELASLLSLVKEGALDFLISNVPAPAGEDSFALSRELSRSPFVIAGTREFLPKRRGFPGSLTGLPLMSLRSPAGAHLHFEQFMKSRKVEANFKGTIEDVALLRLVALSGAALVYIPKVGIQRELKAGELCIVHEFKQVAESFYLITHRLSSASPELSEILALLPSRHA